MSGKREKMRQEKNTYNKILNSLVGAHKNQDSSSTTSPIESNDSDTAELETSDSELHDTQEDTSYPYELYDEDVDEVCSTALKVAQELEASDVLIVEGKAPWIRRGGTFEAVHWLPVISQEDAEMVVYQWGNGIDTSETIEVDGDRWRLTCFDTSDGLRASFRRIPKYPPPIHELNLPPTISTLTRLKDGLIVASGATGAGKSTTLASLINSINLTQSVHILTIEDPVEYIYPEALSVVSQRNVPVESQKFALKTALRSDPDIVLLGECRLREHFELCVTLAATGHLVFTSVHARDAASTCQRFQEATGDIGRSNLAQTLRAVISQRLIPDAHDISQRHLAVELMLTNPAIQAYIRPGGDITGIQRHLRDSHAGMDNILLNLVLQGKISADSGRNAALDIDHFEFLLENTHH